MDRKLSLIIQFAAMDKLAPTLKKIVGLGDSGAASLARMKREARDLDNQLKAARAATAGAAGNITQLIARERELEAAIAGVNRQLDRQKRNMAIDNRVAKVQGQAQSYRSAGQDNMLAGATMATPLILAGKQAMDFSSGMVDIQQKAELTNAETAKMSGNIMAAARAAHQLPENLRASIDVLSGKGMNPRDAVKLVAPIGRLGTAFKVDLADAANAAWANINNLKVPLAQTGKAFDIMAEGGKLGAFEVKDMARHFPGLTAQMQALGQTGTPAVADLTAALQVAMNTAGNSDEAANNIANLLDKINSPTTINAFAKKFGIDLPAAMKKARSEGKTTMEAFAELTSKATGGDMEKLGFIVEDRQARMGLLAIMQNMEKYKQIRAQIGKASGTVDRAFSQRELQDASVAWNGFKGNLATTAILLGNTLLPAAGRFLGMLNSMLGGISDWAQANPQLASGIMTLVAGLTMARLGLGAMQFAFGSVLGPAATAWGWFMKFRAAGSIASAFPALAKGFAMVRTAALFMAQGVMRAGLMMMANPVVLAITAIVLVIAGAGYLIYRHWDTIKAAFQTGLGYLDQAWQWIKGKFLAFPALFGPLGVIGAYVADNWGTIRDAFATGASWIGQAWSFVQGKMSLFSPLFLPIRLAAGLVRENWSAIQAAFNTAAAWLAPAIDWVREKVGPFAIVFSPLRMAAAAVQQAWAMIQAGYTSASGWLGPAIDFVRDTVAPAAIVFSPLQIGAQLVVASWRLMSAAFTAGSAMLATAWATIKAKFDQGVAFLRSLPGQMAAIGSAIVQGLVRGILAAPGAVAGALNSVVTAGITSIKTKLGIKSPSRLFMGFGGYLTEGLAIGVDQGAKRPLGAVDRLAASVAAAMALASSPALAIGADIATPALPATPALRYAAGIDAPAPPRLPAMQDLRIGAGIADPAAPRLPAPAALRYAASIAAPAAPRLPTVPGLRIGAGIDRPGLPALPQPDSVRFGASIAPPEMPAMAPLKLMAQLMMPKGAPRLPNASLGVTPQISGKSILGAMPDVTAARRPAPFAFGGEEQRPTLLRPAARLAPVNPPRGGTSAAGGAGVTKREGDTYHITIQQQPGEDGEALAQRLMDTIKRQKSNSGRGSYRDE